MCRHSTNQLEELVLGDQSVQVFIGPLYHVFQVLLRNIATNVVSNAAEVLHTDEPSLFSIEQGEDPVDVFPRIALQKARGHQVDKLFEGNAALSFCCQVDSQLINRLVAGFGTQRCNGVLDFFVSEWVHLGLMIPACSLSNISKTSLISRMSV